MTNFESLVFSIADILELHEWCIDTKENTLKNAFIKPEGSRYIYSKLAMAQWLLKQSKNIDWNKIPIDTLVAVRDYEDQEWQIRYFSHYDSEYYYTFSQGHTSKTQKSIDAVPWNQARLVN